MSRPRQSCRGLQLLEEWTKRLSFERTAVSQHEQRRHSSTFPKRTAGHRIDSLFQIASRATQKQRPLALLACLGEGRDCCLPLVFDPKILGVAVINQRGIVFGDAGSLGLSQLARVALE